LKLVFGIGDKLFEKIKDDVGLWICNFGYWFK
jgi:hypothetical protein